MTKANETPTSDRNRVCAAIVAYFPDHGFANRLRLLFPQVDALVVIDNTPAGSAPWLATLSQHDKTQFDVIENRSNLGVAAALNQGLEHAAQTDCQWVLTLDQDTQCFPDIIETLLSVARSSRPQPLVIGGNYFDSKKGRHDASVGEGSDCLESETVITSGCLVDAAFARAIGGFREDYFIDQLDHEFCLRARANGGRVVRTGKPVMHHTVGGHTGPKVPFLGTMLPNHSPLRKYYITRNTVTTVAKYWKREPKWCLRRGARLLIGLVSLATIEHHRIAKIRAFVDGFIDGTQGKMGPCHRDWLKHWGSL